MNSGKVVLILGGTGGIGSEAVKQFSEAGYKIYSTFHSNSALAKELSTKFNIEFLRVDTNTPQEIEQVIQSVAAKEGKIDIVINCAISSLKLKRFEDLTMDEITGDMSNIFIGALQLLKSALPIMRKAKSGMIINIASQAVKSYPARMASYAAAKAAVLTLYKCVSAEVANAGIKIISISPSFVETKLIGAMPSMLLQMEREKQESKNLLQPREITMLLLHVAKNNFPNGAVLEINSSQDIEKYLSAHA